MVSMFLKVFSTFLCSLNVPRIWKKKSLTSIVFVFGIQSLCCGLIHLLRTWWNSQEIVEVFIDEIV